MEKAAADAGETMSSSTVDAAVAVAVGIALFSGIVGALLWVFMAVMNGKGKKCARTVATVLFGISVLFTLGSLVQEAPALSRILSLVSLVLGGTSSSCCSAPTPRSTTTPSPHRGSEPTTGNGERPPRRWTLAVSRGISDSSRSGA